MEDENLSGVKDEAGTAGAGSGMRGETLRKREEEKEAKERRALIDAAIRGEAKRKKKSKRARETGEFSVSIHLIFLLRIPFEAVRRWR